MVKIVVFAVTNEVRFKNEPEYIKLIFVVIFSYSENRKLLWRFLSHLRFEILTIGIAFVTPPFSKSRSNRIHTALMLIR